MIKQINKFFFVIVFICSSCAVYSLDKNKMILLNFGPRNGSEQAIGLCEFSFYDDGLLQRINFFTNTGKSNNPYDWEKIKYENTRFLEIVRNDEDIIAIYFTDNSVEGKIVKWFKLAGKDRIIEMALDGQSETGEMKIDQTTGEYTYFNNNEQWGYFQMTDEKEDFYRYTNKGKGLFYQSVYIFGKNNMDITINNTAKRFHPELQSYDDNFQVNYTYDGKIRYTITRTEEDYPADFVDKLDLITTLDIVAARINLAGIRKYSDIKI